MLSSVLKWPDYLILAGFLVISLAIGLYHSLTGGRQKTTEEFIMANRRLQVIPTAISLVVSYQSAILVLGMTAEMYSYGAQLMILSGFCFIINAIVVERIFVPWLYRLKLVSVNEYFHLRFGSDSVTLCASLMGIIASIFYMGSCMYAPSAALESVTGFPLKLSIPMMSVVCMAYTALGGMRAVIWTDVFQFLTMVGGMLAVCIQGIIVVGGVGNVLKLAGEEGRMNLVDWSPDPTVRHTFWGLMIGGSINWMPAYGLTQAAVQRFSATQSLNKARLTILLNIPGVFFIEFLAGFTGLVVVAYYSQIRCDPLANKEVNSENQLLPLFVMTLFRNAPGFAGLFLATLYGGALSSVSSALSGSAANCWEDILQRIFKHLPESRKAIINRILVLVFGTLATSVAFLVAILPGPILQISSALCSSVGGPMFGLFMMGGLSKIANWKGALTGGVVGLLINGWLQVGSMSIPNKHPPLPLMAVDGCLVDQNSTVFAFLTGENCTGTIELPITTIGALPSAELYGLDRFYCLSYTWYVLIGMLTTLSVGMAVSLIFRDRVLEKAVDDSLLMKFTNCSWKDQKEEEDQLQPEKPSKEANMAIEPIANSRNIDKVTESSM